MLKIAANTLYEIVSIFDDWVLRIVQGMQPPKTEENETATNKDPAACHILKCPNLSICQEKEEAIKTKDIPRRNNKQIRNINHFQFLREKSIDIKTKNVTI